MSQIDKAQLKNVKTCKDTIQVKLIEAASVKSFISSKDFCEKLEQGNALPFKKNVRFTKEQKMYIENLFEQGEKDKRNISNPVEDI